MVENVTITRVSVTDKKKDGTKLVNKYGEFFRVGIQVKEKLDTMGDPIWINGFMKKRPEWKEGEVIQVELAEEDYQGITQLKFRLPKKEALQDDKIKALEAEIAKLRSSKPEEDVIDNF